MRLPRTKPDEVLTTDQAAVFLGISRNRVQELIRANVLPATRFGPTGPYQVKRSDLHFAEARRGPGRPRKVNAKRNGQAVRKQKK